MNDMWPETIPDDRSANLLATEKKRFQVDAFEALGRWKYLLLPETAKAASELALTRRTETLSTDGFGS